MSEVGELSWTGQCSACGLAELESNVSQMVARSGPNWTRWREAMAGCVGGTVLSDAERAVLEAWRESLTT